MDIKYAYYNTSKGYRVLGGTAVHFLKADGSLDGTEYIDKTSFQDIAGTKSFYTSGGNNYDNNSLHIASSDGSDPAITFNKVGTIAGQLKMNVAGYHFLNPGLGYYPVNAAGYVKSGSDDSYVLLGGGGHIPVSSFNSSNYVDYIDNREISPSEISPLQLGYGFTAWDNNNTGPWADFLHFGSYTDASGGDQNLILFKKNGFGLRQYQSNWQDSSPYTAHVDYWHSGHFTSTDINNWNSVFNNQGNFVTLNTEQNILARKTFLGGTGNTYDKTSLEVRGNGATDTILPAISFHQPGLYAGTLSYKSDGFHFMDLNDVGHQNIYAYGFKKQDSDDNYFLTGGGGHKPISDFITETSWNNITGKKWFKTDGGNDWDNNTLRIQGINGYDAGLTFYRDGINTAQIIYNGYSFQTQSSDGVGFTPIKSSHFIKNGSDANHVLLGDGDHKALSDFATSAQLGNYLPLSGGTLTSGGIIDANGNIFLQQVDVGGNATGMFWQTMDNTQFNAGIGAYTENGNFYWNYLGWGPYPWSTATSLAVGDNIFTYKDNRVWHEGILEDYHLYGLGKINVSILHDLNTYGTLSTGFYSMNNAQNAPYDYGTTIKVMRSDDEGTEIATSVWGDGLAFRGYVSAAYGPWMHVWHSGNLNPLQVGSAIEIDSVDYINNGSDTRRNKTWFDYGWANTYAGSVINFSGHPNNNYSTELFGQFNAGGNRFGLRTHNGDTNTWNPVRWIWHDGNFDPGNYLTNRGNWHNALLAKTDNPNSVTEYADDPSVTGFKSTWGTSLHIKGNGPWYNRLDFNTNGRLDWWQGINTTDMTYKGQIAVIPDGITNWTSAIFNPDSKANAWDNAIAIGFSGGNVPTNDGSQYPYMYSVAGGAIAIATQGFVNTNFIPKSHPVYNITQANINSWNAAASGSSHVHSNLSYLNNIDQWLGVGQAPRFNSVFLMDAFGYGQLVLGEGNIGGELGLVDISNKRFYAGRINEYLKYGSSIDGFEGLNIHFDAQLLGIGRELGNHEDKVQLAGDLSVDTIDINHNSRQLILNPLYNTDGDVRHSRNAHIYIVTRNAVSLPDKPILGQRIEIFNDSDSDIEVTHSNVGTMFKVPGFCKVTGIAANKGFRFDAEPVYTKQYDI